MAGRITLKNRSDIPGVSRLNKFWQIKGARPMFKPLRKGMSLPGGINSIQELEKLILSYGFRGIEYGNWLTEEDKFNYLASTYLALYDLNKVLKFQKNIGLDRSISLGFGSRGISRSLAHYNIRDKFININRYEKTYDRVKEYSFRDSGGIHSLGHEYGHALDYIFGAHIEQSKTSLSLTAGNYHGTKIPNWKQAPDTLRGIMGMIIHLYIYKDAATSTKEGTAFTDSYKKIAGGREYYRRHNEIFARLFEKYIHWKLEAVGVKNTTLTKEKYDHNVYATDKDFKRIVPWMDKLVELMRKQVVKDIQKVKQMPQKMAASRKQMEMF